MTNEQIVNDPYLTLDQKIERITENSIRGLFAILPQEMGKEDLDALIAAKPPRSSRALNSLLS